MQVPARFQSALNQPDSLESSAVKQLEASMLETFPGGEVLKKESARALLNPIFNAAVKHIDKFDRDSGGASYTSTNQLLMSYMENGEIRLTFARRPASFNVWVGLLGALLGFDVVGGEALYLPVTRGYYHLTEHNYPVRTGHC